MDGWWMDGSAGGLTDGWAEKWVIGWTDGYIEI